MIEGADQVLESESGLDQKIIAAFERITQAIRTLAWETGKKTQLNPAQANLLAFLFRHRHRQYGISFLAKEFDVSKASISDTATSLVKKGLVRKATPINDLRGSTLALTPEGKNTALEVAKYSDLMFKAINTIDNSNKEALFGSLVNIIHTLNQNGVINVQRMCLNCHNYQSKSGLHYCNLLKKQLLLSELQLDCDEHIATKILQFF